jgi:hypothetical protein
LLLVVVVIVTSVVFSQLGCQTANCSPQLLYSKLQLLYCLSECLDLICLF